MGVPVTRLRDLRAETRAIDSRMNVLLFGSAFCILIMFAMLSLWEHLRGALPDDSGWDAGDICRDTVPERHVGLLTPEERRLLCGPKHIEEVAP